MRNYRRIILAVANGSAEKVKKYVKEALDHGIPPEEILEEALIKGMQRISDKYYGQAVFVPEILLASRAFHAGMKTLEPVMLKDAVPRLGRVVIGTVAGDLHDIGKNLVVTFLRAKGYQVFDLGIDVQPEDFVEAVEKNQAQVLGMSALLTTTMPVMDKTIQLLEKKKLRDQVKVVVGGGPITKEYGEKIGADGYAPNAYAAVELVGSCLKELNGG